MPIGVLATETLYQQDADNCLHEFGPVKNVASFADNLGKFCAEA